MFEFFFNHNFMWDADAYGASNQKHEHLNVEWKLELVETIQGLYFRMSYWDAND